jgi:hypothetical protein
MAFLEAFSKKIQNFEWKKFKGGTKFKNGDTCFFKIKLADSSILEKANHFLPKSFRLAPM